MSALDYVVLFGTLLLIVGYGIWNTRGQNKLSTYLRGDNSMGWGTIGLSVMATQASAITFISTPGQGYDGGMSFVQNYFGLPIALIIVSAVFIPIFYRLNVYTAYEYLESRFDLKSRLLGASLFLIQRGLAAGITIYAPAIILSSVLQWNLTLTILLTGGLVIIYTVSGGTKAVSITQKQQMAVIMGGMFAAFFILVDYITEFVPLGKALHLAGSLGKLNAVKLTFDPGDRYNIWSGLTGGLFLALSYFGTDQSQVQRYLGGKGIAESRMGLMFNAVLKIPMQFFILLTGVLVYVFYIFYTPPVHFKESNLEAVHASPYQEELKGLSKEYQVLIRQRKEEAIRLDAGNDVDYTSFVEADKASLAVREDVKGLVKKVDPSLATKDSDYVFITFIMDYLPHGLIGLLMAVIFSAAMSSTASELNALSSTTTVDFYQRLFKTKSEVSLWVSKGFTLLWGLIAVGFALLADNSENLIEAVNIVGSVFYGTILGIFLVAFFFAHVRGTQVFVAALIAQLAVFVMFFALDIGYLWFNAIGCGIVVAISNLLTLVIRK